MLVYKNNQQLRIIGSSKFKDLGTRPFYLMRSYDQIDTDLSNINEELFMKTLVSYRDFERQTVLKYIYEKKSKIPKKIKRDIPEQKMGVTEKSYSSKEAYPYFNNKMDPVYDFPKLITIYLLHGLIKK